jgi:type 1 fimbriae regulatory protein FimB/type 1 fimbriae regulatory protein FimE
VAKKYQTTTTLLASVEKQGERREARRRPNKELRTREHLTPSEVEELMSVARQRGRNGHRDATMILMAYRHGMRPSELVDLRWDQVDLKTAALHVRRRKKGKESTHPLRGDELRALRKLQREAPASPYLFVSEHGTPISVHGWQKLVERIGQAWNGQEGTDLKVHAHMLRHACGFALANAGHDTRAIQDYLGHVSIQHTVRYTQLSPAAFKNFWK